MTNSSRQQGVTLIELMIAVVIVAILATIAAPSYRNYILKANRAVGTELLTTTQYKLESAFTRFNRYDTDLISTICGTAVQTNSVGDEGYTCGGDGSYLITVTATGTGNDYILLAAPNGGQEKDGYLLLEYSPATRKLTKTHRTPDGVVKDGWDFTPGQ